MAEKHYTQYYVAFLDILGFKNRVNDKNTSCQEILDTYEFVNYRHKEFFGEKYSHLQDSIKIKIMSDSICLYTEVDTPNALYLLIAYCIGFQHDLLICDPNIFMRGGITVGEMYAEGDVMFGPALTEAYLLEEKNAKVPRIIIRKSTVDYGKSRCDATFQELIDKWIFRDDDAFYTLDYFRILVYKGDDDALNGVKTTVSNQLDATIDESIRNKYLYVEKHVQRHLKEKENA